MNGKQRKTSDKPYFKLSLVVTILHFAIFQLVSSNLNPPACKNDTVLRNEFSGYKLYQTNVSTEKELKILIDYVEEAELDVWNVPTLNSPGVIMVSLHEDNDFVEFLKNSAISYIILHEDIENLVSQQYSGLQKVRGKEMTWSEYHYPEDILSWLDELHEIIERDSTISVKEMIIGSSTENRDIKLIKVSSGSSEGKRGVFIDAGIHAREWITPAVATYILKDLITNTTANEEVLRRFDFYILPLINPDGYSHSCYYNRFWRKSRRSSDMFLNFLGCRGIDLNRNFGYTWGGRGSGKQPCSLIYAGEKAFSEPETAAIRDFIEDDANKDIDWIAYFSLHSFGQKWMSPWGHTSALPEDYEEMERVASIGIEALKAVYGTRYSFGSTNNIMYTASGSSADWFKGAVGVKYSYTLELRDYGIFGFLLPAYYIVPTSEETWAGIKGALGAIPDN